MRHLDVFLLRDSAIGRLGANGSFGGRQESQKVFTSKVSFLRRASIVSSVEQALLAEEPTTTL